MKNNIRSVFTIYINRKLKESSIKTSESEIKSISPNVFDCNVLSF